MIVISCLFGTTISSIENIRNETPLIDYDYTSNALYRFENKMIVSTRHKIEEYEILPQGYLHRHSIYEKKISRGGYIDGNLYYDFDPISTQGVVRIIVFNLDHTPMEVIATFDLYMNNGSRIDVLFTDHHIIVTDSQNSRVVLINKTTFEIDGYIEGFLDILTHRSIALSGTKLIKYDIIGEAGNLEMILSFSDFAYCYETNDYRYEEKSELQIPQNIQAIIDIVIIDNVAILSCWGGVILIDIHDIENPTIVHQILNDKQICTALFNEDYIFASTTDGDLLVYDINDYSLVYSDTGISVYRNSMHLMMPYLYMNKGNGLKLYDVSDGIVEIAYYGIDSRITSISLSEEDMHYSFVNNHDRYLEGIYRYYFYSAVEDEMVCSYESENLIFSYFAIREDTLSAIVLDTNTNYCYLNTYHISDRQLRLQHSIFIATYPYISPYYFHQINNKYYVQNFPPWSVAVYELNNTGFVLLGTYPGRMPSHFSNISQEYILNYNNGRILVRDINDYTNILLNQPVINSPNSQLFHYDANVFLLHDFGSFQTFTQSTYAYSFDTTAPSTSLIYQGNTWMNTFNKVMAIHDGDTTNVGFYTITNNQVNRIGEIADPSQQHSRYFLFPARNKIVRFSPSSIKTYDFDYTVNNIDITIPTYQPQLLGNYPNPFNAETTIYFSIGLPPSVREDKGGVNVRLDIYNIKGQRITTLIDDVYKPGTYNVVWKGVDASDRPVSSGIYFYRMRTDDYTSVKRMMLVK